MMTRARHRVNCGELFAAVPAQKIDEAYDRMQRSDVKYRFVIDNRTLAG